MLFISRIDQNSQIIELRCQISQLLKLEMQHFELSEIIVSIQSAIFITAILKDFTVYVLLVVCAV